MAVPAKIEGHTTTLRGDGHAVGDLAIIHCTTDGVPRSISAWELSPEEVDEIQRTGLIFVHVLSRSHPAICVDGFHPRETWAELDAGGISGRGAS